MTAAALTHLDHLIGLLGSLTDEGPVGGGGIRARHSGQRETSGNEHREKNRTHRFSLLGLLPP